MRILQVNQNYNFGSTGKIMKDINDLIVECGGESFMLTAYANGNADNMFVTERLPLYWAIRKNILFPRMTGLNGYRARRRTNKAIMWIESIKPDLVHLHNIHGDWINIGLLFDYLHRIHIPIVWTLHDCWSFTGRCSYFDQCNCNKWETVCRNCPDLKIYPQSYLFDFSTKMYRDKKKMFSSLDNMIVVTPSDWLGRYVKRSFLSQYPCITIHNGIDLGLFARKEEQYVGLQKEKRKIVLGVAASWTQRKGLMDFYHIFSLLDPSEFVVVVVGLSASQKNKLPKGMVGIERTHNSEELAQLYSHAAVFVNPTYQDNYPTVNLEAIACGTPVITYNTGGSVESVTEATGIIIQKGDVRGLVEAIKTICSSGKDYTQDCLQYAHDYFNKFECYKDYIRLFQSILLEQSK